MSHRPDPEMNSVHSVKILLCYILDKLNRTVTEEQLRLISEDSGVISYFFFSDALEELIANGSVEVTEEDGRRIISITEKGRLGSEYFNRYIPLVFRKKLLHSAFSFFVREENEGMCSCDISDNEDGSTVSFRLCDGNTELISMSFYAPDHSQAELISEKIKANPMGAYKNILEYLLNNQEEKIDVEKYL